MRNTKRDVVLLTGVTGQIVSELALRLLDGGEKILCVVRSKGTISAVERVRALFPDKYIGSYYVVEGDIIEPHAGFTSSDISFWRGRISKVVHGAADLSFKPEYAEHVMNVNLNGTKNMLDLADYLDINDFHYISTAYVSGSSPSFSETDLDKKQTFANSYEKSKFEAERLIHRWADTNRKFTIHRPSIVLGNSITGEVRIFNGYYSFFKPFWMMYNSYFSMWRENREVCERSGVRFTDNGVMEIPIHLDYSDTSVLNIVTTDWVSEGMYEILKHRSNNRTHHHVHLDPPLVSWVIHESLKTLRISGISNATAHVNRVGPAVARIQRLVNCSVNMYSHYIQHNTVFSCSDTHGRFVRPPHPVIDSSLLHMMLAYAVAERFEKKL